MANIQKEALLRLVLDAEKASKDSEELIAQLQQIGNLLKMIGSLGTQAFRELDAEIKTATKSAKGLSQVVDSLSDAYKKGVKEVKDFNEGIKPAKVEAAAGSLDDLRAQLARVRTELNATAATIDGKANPAYEELSRTYSQLDNKIKSQQGALRAQSAAAQSAEGSINNLRERLKAMNRELDNTAPQINGEVNPAFEKMILEARHLQNELLDLEGASGRFQRNVGNYPSLGNQLKDVGAQFVAAFSITAVIEKVGQAFSAVVEVGKRFEASISNLAAITGASGKDLEFLSDEAKRLGVETGKGAANIAEAFKLIASAKPELLSNAAALVEVTDAAILLSKAAGLDVPQAANALTTVLNQMKLPASEAARVVDLLAAGAKLGAVEIPDLTDAFKKFGPVAQSAGVSTAEAVAAIETLGESKFEAEIAGNALKNMFIKLQKEGIGVTKEGTLNLGEALNQLAPDIKNVTKLSELFGLENVAAAQALISSRERYVDLTQAIARESGVAAEQARLNNDNLTGDLEKFNAVLENIEITVFQEFSGGARDATQAATGFLKYLSDGLQEGLQGLTAPFREAFDAVKGVLAPLKELFGGAGSEVNVFATILKGLGENFRFILKPVVSLMKTIGTAIGVIVRIKDAIVEFVEETPFLLAAVNGISAAFDAVVEFITGAIDKVKGFADTVANFSGISLISSLFGTADEELNNVEKFKAVFGNMENALEQLRQKYGATVDDMAAFRDKFDKSLLVGKGFNEQIQVVNDEFVKFQAARLEAESKARAEREAAEAQATEKVKEQAEEQRKVKEKALEDERRNSEEALKRLKDQAAKELENLRTKTEDGLEIIREGRLKELTSQAEFAKISADEQKLLLDQINADIDAKRDALRKQREEDAKKDLEQLVKETVDQIKASQETALSALASLQFEALTLLEDQEREALANVVGSNRAALEERERLSIEYDKRRSDLVAASKEAEIEAEQEAIAQQLQIADLENTDRLALEQEFLDNKRLLHDLDVQQEREAEEQKRSEIEKTIALRQQAVDAFGSALTAIGDLQVQDAEMNIARIKSKVAANEQEQAALDRAAAREEERKERALAFNRKVAAAQALVDQISIISNSIKAVTGASALPFPGNLVAIASIIGAVASAISQLKAITAPTKFAEGGPVTGGGVAEGPSHSGGGIPGRVRSTGAPIEFEGGEYIVRAASVNPRTLPLLNSVNAGDYAQPPIPRAPSLHAIRFASGGLVPGGAPSSIDTKAMAADFIEALQNMKPLQAVTSIVDQRTATADLARKEAKASMFRQS